MKHRKMIIGRDVVSHRHAAKCEVNLNAAMPVGEVIGAISAAINQIGPKGWVIYHTTKLVDGVPSSTPPDNVRQAVRKVCGANPDAGRRWAKGLPVMKTSKANGQVIRQWIVIAARERAFS